MNLLFAGNYQLDEKKICELEQLGVNVTIMKEENFPLSVKPEEIDAIVCNWLFVNHNISQFTKLKYVQLLSAGMERIPMDYAVQNNIKVNNARGVYSIPMAEFAISGVLQLLKKSKCFMEQQVQHKWEKHRDLGELSDKTVCVLGMGSVGCEVAKKFSVFAKEIIGVDLYEVQNKYFNKYCEIGMMDKAISASDIVVITLPLTKETEYLFNKSIFKEMKDTSIIVNIARGKIINELELIEALNKKDIGGAVLDVFEEEPLNKNSEIWDIPNVIATPHNSFVSQMNDNRMWNIIIDNLREYIQGVNNG